MSVVVKLYFHEVKIKNAMATSYIRYYTACKQNILPDANRFRLKRNTEMLGVLRVVILNEQTKTTHKGYNVISRWISFGNNLFVEIGTP